MTVRTIAECDYCGYQEKDMPQMFVDGWLPEGWFRLEAHLDNNKRRDRTFHSEECVVSYLKARVE